jgi:hypothetical protein
MKETFKFLYLGLGVLKFMVGGSRRYNSCFLESREVGRTCFKSKGQGNVMGRRVGPQGSCARRGMGRKSVRWLQALVILPSRSIISSNNRLLVYSASATASAITSSHSLALGR